MYMYMYILTSVYLAVCVYMYIYMYILTSRGVCVHVYTYPLFVYLAVRVYIMYVLLSVDTSSASLSVCVQPYMVPWSWHRNTVGISARVQCWASETIFYILHISVC